MTTPQRNARSLALLAPLACPAVDLLCALYVIVARQVRVIIEALRADHAARRALASHRAAMLNPVQLPFVASDYPLLGDADVIKLDGIPPVLCDADVVVDAPLARRLADLTPAIEASDVVVTMAACQPIVERAEWVPMTGLRHFAVKVEHVDPAPARSTLVEGEHPNVTIARAIDEARRALESHVETTVPGFAPAVDVQHLTYRELQTLAKAAGIKANQSADKLRAALIVRQGA